MKKWLMIVLALYLLVFTACGHEVAAEEPVRLSVPPMEEHEVCLAENVQDFKIIVTSLQKSYDRSCLNSDIPIQGGVQIQYCGPQDELEISHTKPAYGLALYKGHKNIMSLNVCLDSANVTVLSKEQSYEDTWWANSASVYTGDQVPMISSLDPGEYIIRVAVSFDYALNEKETCRNIEHEMEIPITLY